MVQLRPLAATSKTPKMAKSKTPKKSSAVDTSAKPEVKTLKQAKNTPAKAALQTPKLKKDALVKEVKSTPKVAVLQTPKMKKKVLAKEAKNTPKAATLIPKNGIASAKKNKAKIAKVDTQSEDVEMESEEDEETPLAEPSPKKQAVMSDNAEESSEEEEIEVKPNSGKSSAPKKTNFRKIGNKFGLYFRGLNFYSDENGVLKHFSRFGTVTKCNIPKSTIPLNGKKRLNKGFGFVEFTSQAAVDKALAAVHALDCRILEVAVNDTELARKRKTEDSNQPGGDRKRKRATFDNELFVVCLNTNSSKDTIKEHFSQFGEVVNVNLPIKRKSSEKRGFAYVAFKEAAALQKAMADTNQEIDSAKIVIKHTKKAGVNEPFQKPSHPNELFVGGLKTSIQMHTLKQHFSKYGKVDNVTLPMNRRGSRNKCFGFVSFESAKSLERAVEDYHEIDGRKVDVRAGSRSDDAAVSKKVKAAPAAAKIEEEDDENDEAEGEDEDEEAEDEEEDDEDDDEDVEGEGEDDDESEEDNDDA